MAEELIMDSKMKNILYTMREMQLSDMPELMYLKNEEGWNQTEQDWEMLIKYKGSVNLVAEIEDQIIGSLTAINYVNKIAWIGMMLINKKYRRMGISKSLLNAAIEELKVCDSIKLDATPAGHHVYEKIGFIDEYDIDRITNPSVKNISQSEKIKAQKASIGELNEIAELDEEIFGANRKEMLTNLFIRYPELALTIKEDNKIVAFSFGRKGTKYIQIGPVYASTDEECKALIATCANKIVSKPVVLDLLSDKDGIKNWLSENGFEKQRSFKRMYWNNNPYSGLTERQYLITGPELG